MNPSAAPATRRIRIHGGGVDCHPVGEQAAIFGEWLGAGYALDYVEGPEAFDGLESSDLFLALGFFWSQSPQITFATPIPYPEVSPARKAVLADFVASGKPLLGYHGGIASYDTWPGFGHLLGFQWNWSISAHTAYDRWSVQVKDTGHPVIAGVEDYTLEDELYYNLQVPGDMKLQIHAAATGPTHHHPMVMTGEGGRIDGAGKTAYLANGHDLTSLECPALRTLFVNTVTWLLS